MKINYSKLCLDLLSPLSLRHREVLERRFGLVSQEKETLESIGRAFNITRERIRQIEQEGLSEIKKDKKKLAPVFRYFEDALDKFGGVKKEELLISFLGEEKDKEKVFFFLCLNSNFKRILEDRDFYSFWLKGKDSLTFLKKIIDIALSNLKKEKQLFTLDGFCRHIKPEIEKAIRKKIGLKEFESFLEISKNIQKNFEGKIGIKNWIEVSPRGVKDKAFLVLKKEKRPLHFSEVALMIKSSSFFPEKGIHPATVHNELIKDERFVLVGRGLYALKEWGYETGTVKDVILSILSESQKPLTKQEIINKVLKKRIVKENTIFLNLQDKNKFSKTSKGKYILKDIKQDIKEA